MNELPKIVNDRLRAASLDQAAHASQAPLPSHPDAALFNAFSEQLLSAPERENVLQHLALCGDCREVVTLAVDAANVFSMDHAPDRETTLAAPAAAAFDAVGSGTRDWTPIPASKKTRNRRWLTSTGFAWPNLRWAALAAGVAVAAAALLVHPGRLNQSPSSSPSHPIASSSAPLPLSSEPPADSSTPSVRFQSPSMQSALSLKAIDPARHSNESIPSHEKRVPSPDRAFAPSTQPTKAVDVATERPQTETPLSASPTLMAEMAESESAEETGTASGHDAPAIEKAKPAMAASSTNSASAEAAALTVNTVWQIAGGALQKSPDGGRTWQSAIQPDRSLLCYAAHDQDVWAGGEGGLLFHSSDNGMTWLPVQPSINDNDHLTSDITRIDLRNIDLRNIDLRNVGVRTIDSHNLASPESIQIVVTTANSELWTSTDSGHTWRKLEEKK